MVGRPPRRTFWAALALAACGGMTSAAAPSDPLAAYLWKNRVLVVAAPNASDPRYEAQRASYAATLVARERSQAGLDLVMLEALGHGSHSEVLRRRVGMPVEDAFRVVLVGKDGGVKLSSEQPIGFERLVATINAMPMRQEEMRRR